MDKHIKVVENCTVKFLPWTNRGPQGTWIADVSKAINSWEPQMNPQYSLQPPIAQVNDDVLPGGLSNVFYEGKMT